MQSTCTFPGCDKSYYAKGLCSGHHMQQRKGKELKPLQPSSRGLTPEQRFWAKVHKSSDCWVWTKGISPDGYGKFWFNGRSVRAHRFSWELVNGQIPEGMVIDHRCHNLRCVNPAHLRVVSNAQNSQHRVGAMRNSKSGVRGVFWDKQAGSWRVYSTLKGRTYFGGYHSTLEGADSAAQALRSRLYTHDDHEQWVSMQKAP